MATQRILSSEVQPGDIIVFMGTPHLVDSTSERNGFGDPIARSADGWGITLADPTRLDVMR